MLDAHTLSILLSEPFSTLKTDVRKLQRLALYYEQIFGVEVCVGCGGDKKFEQFYYKLKEKGVTAMENKQDSAFKFKKGISGVPMDFGSNKFLTPTNLTDADAIEFLSINPKRISLFAAFPSDWEAKVAEFKATGKVETKETPAPEVVDPVIDEVKDETAAADVPAEQKAQPAKKSTSKSATKAK